MAEHRIQLPGGTCLTSRKDALLVNGYTLNYASYNTQCNTVAGAVDTEFARVTGKFFDDTLPSRQREIKHEGNFPYITIHVTMAKNKYHIYQFRFTKMCVGIHFWAELERIVDRIAEIQAAV